MKIATKPGSVRLAFRDGEEGAAPVDRAVCDELLAMRPACVTFKLTPDANAARRLADWFAKQEHGFSIAWPGRVAFFHYVTHANVPAWLDRGWIIADTLADTKHGEFAVLMKWAGEGEPPEELKRKEAGQ